MINRVCALFAGLLVSATAFANACVPPMATGLVSSFSDSAQYLELVVIGHFPQPSKPDVFVVESSPKGDIQPGQYTLRLERPMGPETDSMGCPAWNDGPFPATQLKLAPSDIWMLLLREADGNRLLVSIDDVFAAKIVAGKLIYRNELGTDKGFFETDLDQFLKWYQHKPRQPYDADDLNKWKDKAPAWQPILPPGSQKKP